METKIVRLNAKWRKPNIGDRLCLVEGDEWSVTAVKELEDGFEVEVEVPDGK